MFTNNNLIDLINGIYALLGSKFRIYESDGDFACKVFWDIEDNERIEAIKKLRKYAGVTKQSKRLALHKYATDILKNAIEVRNAKLYRDELLKN